MRKYDRCRSGKFITNPGTPLHKVMHGEVKEDGTIRLIVDRIEDTDAIIDSFRESTDIHNIMARIQAGDINLLNAKKGFFADVTEMPKTYAEMLDLIEKGKYFFNRLPAEIKEQYNNDFNQFFADFDNAIKMLQPDNSADYSGGKEEPIKKESAE